MSPGVADRMPEQQWVTSSGRSTKGAVRERRDAQIGGHGLDEPGHRRGGIDARDRPDGGGRLCSRLGASDPGALALVHPASLS
jgi:hypothetical protein